MEARQACQVTNQLSSSQPELPFEILNEIFSYSTLADKAVLIACSKFFSQMLSNSIYYSLTFNDSLSSLKSAGLLFNYTPTPRYNGPWEYCTNREKRIDYKKLLYLDSPSNKILTSLQHPIFHNLKHLTLPSSNEYSEIVKMLFSPTSFFRRNLESFAFLEPSRMIDRIPYEWKALDMVDWILQSLRMVNLHQNQWLLFHALEKENDELETDKERDDFLLTLIKEFYEDTNSDWLEKFYHRTGSGCVPWNFYYYRGSGSSFNQWIAHNYLSKAEQPSNLYRFYDSYRLSQSSQRQSTTTDSFLPLPRLTPDPFWSTPDSFENLRVLKIGITPLTGLRVIRSIFRTNILPTLRHLTLYSSSEYDDYLEVEQLTTFLDPSDWLLMRFACQGGRFDMTVDWKPDTPNIMHSALQYEELMSLDRSSLDEEELDELKDMSYIGPFLTSLTLIVLEDSLIRLIDIESSDEKVFRLYWGGYDLY